MFKSKGFDIPVISIGNLVVGGSGKSPVTEYLVNLLHGNRIAILSRGYGRKTKGYLLADERSTAQAIGDEPMQFYSKFPEVTVAVCENRVKGINKLKENHDIILLDDAFQHRSVQPGFSILLFEFQKLLEWQFLLPAGNLREHFGGYKRADVLLVTKAPVNITEQQRLRIANKFRKSGFLEKEKLSFSFLVYEDLIHFISGKKKTCSSISENTTIYVLTGIANPQPLMLHLEQYTRNIYHHNYPDHYTFSKQDIERLVNEFSNDVSKEKLVITTEKDTQRLLDNILKELLLNLPVFYLPIKIGVQEQDKATFDQKILDYVSGITRNR